MWECKYCGQKARWFSHAHKECEQKAQTGLQDMVALTTHCVRTGERLDELESRLSKIAKEHLIPDDQVKVSLINGWERAQNQAIAGGLLSGEEEAHLMNFAQRFKLSKRELDRNGAYTRAQQLCLQNLMAMSITCARTGQNFNALDTRLAQMSKEEFVGPDEARPMLIKGWEQSLDQVLHDNVLSENEETNLMEFAKHFDLSQESLNMNDAYTRLVKSSVLREVMEGKAPTKVKVDGQLPFNIQKSESLVWVFKDVSYYEQKVRRHFEGHSQGVSIRVMKGVYYRVGAFKGYPVETTEWTLVETGLLGVTSHNLYFAGPVKSLRIPYPKIVSFAPYEDGIGICRDGASAKPQTFKTGDGWFTYNLITNLAKQVST